MKKVIILVGQRERSGTNFVGSSLFQHPDVDFLSLDNSIGELNLFKDTAIETQVFDKIARVSFGIKKHLILNKPYFFKLYGELWTKFLQEIFEFSEEKVLFIKSPVIYNIEFWQRAFPDSKIAIIVRDGRDNVVSSVKTSYDFRASLSLEKKIKLWFNYVSGRSFVNNIRQWKATGDYILQIEEDSNLAKFKYEDLLNSSSGIQRLLEFYSLRHDEDIVSACLKAPVVGSSTLRGRDQGNWNPDYDTSKYQFVKKWKHWGFLKKMIFKRIAGKTLIALHYESNNKW